MTATAIRSIGYCAHYSRAGDWAFEFALALARRSSLQLNVFHFLSDPYDPEDRTGEGLSRTELARLAIERERELRFRYEDRLGEFLDAGFRLCEDREWIELHRCLARREFQVLVLGYPHLHATFAGKPLEVFAHSFLCPVVLLGPNGPAELRLNQPAKLLADKLGLADVRWTVVESFESSPEIAASDDDMRGASRAWVDL